MWLSDEEVRQLSGAGRARARAGTGSRVGVGVETRNAEQSRTRHLEPSGQAARLAAQRLEQRVGHAAALGVQALDSLALQHLTLHLQSAHCVIGKKLGNNAPQI